MRISNIQINHITSPLGFSLPSPISVSYQLADSRGKTQTGVRFVVEQEQSGLTVYDSGVLPQVEACYPLPVVLAPRTRYRLRVSAQTDAGEQAQGATWFETGKMEEPWQAAWVGVDENLPSVCVEKRFSLSSVPRSARLYVGCAGLYTAQLNGVRVGQEFLTPYCNDYRSWMQIITHDVTELLHAGENTLRFTLGNGWYKGRFSLQNQENIYGDRLAVTAELHIQSETGGEFVLSTDTSWQAKTAKYTENGIYDGVCIDASMAAQPKALAELPISVQLLHDRLSPPVTVQQELTPIRAFRTPKGENCLDFGQNMAGIVRVDTSAFPAQDFRLVFFETLDADGNVYTENLRTARQELIYHTDGSARIVIPEFTYYGFRYVLVDSEQPFSPDAITALVLHSEMPQVGTLETSNPLLNQLIQNIDWGQRGNFVDVPTDCPQRDERLGWTGDAQIFSGSSLYGHDCAGFWEKYLTDMRFEQQKNADGHVPVIVPTFIAEHTQSTMNTGIAAWGDAATVIPWNLYLHTGDPEQLRRHFPLMLDWCRYIRSCDTGSRLWDSGFQLGDWLALDTPEHVKLGLTPESLVASSYYLYSVTLTAKAAQALGEVKQQLELETLAKEIRDAIQKEFVTPGGRIAGGTQTADVLALFLDFAPDRAKTVQDLCDKILRKADGHLNTGFVGTAYLCRALSEAGRSDAAYTLLLERGYPGWLYEVLHGATTVWERWNSVSPDGTLADPEMNSLNHYANGAILEWMYRHMAGLQPDERAVGFRCLHYAPQPDSRLQGCRATLHTPFGLYESAWEISANGLSFLLRVPCSCTAVLDLPDAPETVNLNGEEISYTPGMTLPAGFYTIRYRPLKCYYICYGLDTPVQTVLAHDALFAPLQAIVPQLADVPPVLFATASTTVEKFLEAVGIPLSAHQQELLNEAWVSIHPWNL